MEEKQLTTQLIPTNDFQSTNFHPNRNLGILLSFISLILLGILPIISNSRPEELSAINYAFYLSFWELLFSIPVFLLELKKKDRGIFIPTVSVSSRNKSLYIMGLTGLIFSASTFFYVFSFEKAGTINASLAIQIYPLFSILWESIFLKKKQFWLEILFILTIILGIYYLGTNGNWKLEDFSPWFLMALIVPFLWSIAHVTIKNTLDSSPITPNQVTFFRVLICSVVLFFVSWGINGKDVFSGFTNLEYQKYALIMGFVYYLELVNWFYAVRHVNVSVASSITTPTPVITLLFAIPILGEILYGFQIKGMVIIIIGLFGLILSGYLKEKMQAKKSKQTGIKLIVLNDK